MNTIPFVDETLRTGADIYTDTQTTGQINRLTEGQEDGQTNQQRDHLIKEADIYSIEDLLSKTDTLKEPTKIYCILKSKVLTAKSACNTKTIIQIQHKPTNTHTTEENLQILSTRVYEIQTGLVNDFVR